VLVEEGALMAPLPLPGVTLPPISEDDVGDAVDELADLMGFRVERYEQRRASMICEGLPDRRYVHRAKALVVWVELKKPGGKLTAEQRDWLLDELNAGGLATVIDDVAQFAHLCRMLTRGNSSILLAAARDQCRAWVDLIWQRGERPNSKKRSVSRPRRGRFA
jgi:hypothetical protein